MLSQLVLFLYQILQNNLIKDDMNNYSNSYKDIPYNQIIFLLLETIRFELFHPTSDCIENMNI